MSDAQPVGSEAMDEGHPTEESLYRWALDRLLKDKKTNAEVEEELRRHLRGHGWTESDTNKMIQAVSRRIGAWRKENPQQDDAMAAIMRTLQLLTSRLESV